MIGIMVPDIRGYFESQSAYELEKKLYEFGYTTLLCVTTDTYEKRSPTLMSWLKARLKQLFVWVLPMKKKDFRKI